MAPLVIGAALDAADILKVAAVALAAVAFLAAFGRPRPAALVALALGMLQYGPTKTFHLVPRSFTVLDDVLLCGLGLRWLVDVARRRTSPPVWVTVWLLVWMGTGLLSTLIHGISITTTLASYRWMFLPTVLYMASAQYGRERGFARNVIRVVVTVGLLQAAVAIAQAVVARSIGDTSFGLLGPGGANVLGFVILLAVVLLVAGSTPISRSVWPIILGILGIIAASVSSGDFDDAVRVRARLPGEAHEAGGGARPRRRPGRCGPGGRGGLSGRRLLMCSTRCSPCTSCALSYRTLIVAEDACCPWKRCPASSVRARWPGRSAWGPGRYGSAWHGSSLLAQVRLQGRQLGVDRDLGRVWPGWSAVLPGDPRPSSQSVASQIAAARRFSWARQIALAAPSIVLIGALGMTVLTILEYQPFSYPWWALLGLLEAAYRRFDPGKADGVGGPEPERRHGRNDARGRVVSRSVSDTIQAASGLPV